MSVFFQNILQCEKSNKARYFSNKVSKNKTKYIRVEF